MMMTAVWERTKLGESAREIAQHLYVCLRTVERYRRLLREEGRL